MVMPKRENRNIFLLSLIKDIFSGSRSFKMKLAGKFFKKSDGKETEPVPGPSDLGKKDTASKTKETKRHKLRK